MKIPKIYNPKEVEEKIYNLWLKSGFFNPDKLPKTYNLKPKTYCIVIPPPNITGSLHMGHALNTLVQDILIRWRRLQGFKTLWLLGTDHAGIATQNVVEKELKKEGKTRFDLGRKLFIERIWQWKEKHEKVILDQLKKLGASCDWSRTRFTIDENYSRAVKKAFLHYYKKGLIYKGKRPVNWCPRCQTSLSDLELEYKEEKGKLWYIRYPLQTTNYKLQTTNYIVVATTRPETMLGDTAVAVNPKDIRYKNLIRIQPPLHPPVPGGPLDRVSVILPLINREIPIIEDSLVDQKFGTGAVKITPAHDLTDYEISLRHKLELRQVIDKGGRMTEVPLPYQGLKILEAREKVVNDLKKEGFLEKIEDYSHQVPHCYRCDSKIEIIPSEQWFLKMAGLAKLAIEAVKKGKIKFIPKRTEKIYFDWLKNIKDWCISRQIWWGHKIPLRGTEDVLDTWFSSALWPFATLNWPKKTKDLKRFYPTDVLCTDRGIINLWVARMVFSGIEFMGKIPFKTVYIHATVLTKEGERMSKSLGTGVDPLQLIEKYGADATRFGIAFQIMGGQDIKFVEDNIVMGRKFCNKLWNASRFVLIQIGNSKLEIRNSKQILNPKSKIRNFTPGDKIIIKALNKTVKSVNEDLGNFRFGQAAHKLYDFFWHDFCDVYIEKSKKPRKEPSAQRGKQQTLLYVLLTSLKLLHPFVPFITEEIYQRLIIKNKKRCLMIEEWPHL